MFDSLTLANHPRSSLISKLHKRYQLINRSLQSVYRLLVVLSTKTFLLKTNNSNQFYKVTIMLQKER